MKKFCAAFLLLSGLSFTLLSADEASGGKMFKGRKSGETWGFVNEGRKDYWWAYAHRLGAGNEYLNAGYEAEWVVPAVYTKVSKAFAEGLAGVEWRGAVGYVDSLNRFVIPPVFEPVSEIGTFCMGLAPVKQGGKYGYIDKCGAFVVAPQFDGAESFDVEDGLAVVKMGGRFGAIDVTGDTVVPCRFLTKEAMKFLPVKNKPYREAVKRYHARMAAGELDAVFGPIRAAARKADSLMADAGHVFPVPSCVVAEADGKKGLKREASDTAWVVAPRYDEFTALADGLYVGTTRSDDEDYGRVFVAAYDGYGRLLTPERRVNSLRYEPAEHLLVLQKNQKDGRYAALYSTGGVMVLPFGLDSIGAFSSGVADAWMYQVKGTIDAHGMADPAFLENIEQHAINLDDLSVWYDVLRFYPVSASGQNDVACAMIKRGWYKQGIARLKTASELYPDNETIAKNLKQAKSERKEKRMNRALSILEATGQALSVAAETYAAVQGVKSSGSSAQVVGGQAAGVQNGENKTVARRSKSAGKSKANDHNVGYGMSSYQTDSRTYSNYETMVIKCDGSNCHCKEYQKEMKKLREKITSHGYTRSKSQWETRTNCPCCK